MESAITLSAANHLVGCYGCSTSGRKRGSLCSSCAPNLHPPPKDVERVHDSLSGGPRSCPRRQEHRRRQWLVRQFTTGLYHVHCCELNANEGTDGVECRRKTAVPSRESATVNLLQPLTGVSIGKGRGLQVGSATQ